MIKIKGSLDFNLDYRFENPVELIDSVFDAINKKGAEAIMGGTWIGYYLAGLYISILGVYKHGIVYDIEHTPYDPADPSEIASAASIIVRNDGEVIFIITGADCRRNSELKSWRSCNAEELQAELQKLGKRIDKRRISKKGNELLYERVALSVRRSAALIGSALYEEQKQNGASAKR